MSIIEEAKRRVAEAEAKGLELAKAEEKRRLAEHKKDEAAARKAAAAVVERIKESILEEASKGRRTTRHSIGCSDPWNDSSRHYNWILGSKVEEILNKEGIKAKLHSENHHHTAYGDEFSNSYDEIVFWIEVSF
jgi:hypothetical protein